MTSHGLRLMGDKRLEANCSRIERSLLAVEQEIMQKTRKVGGRLGPPDYLVVEILVKGPSECERVRMRRRLVGGRRRT